MTITDHGSTTGRSPGPSRAAVLLAGTALSVASLVGIPDAGASDTATDTSAADPGSAALVTQSQNQPLALQFVERLTDAEPGTVEATATEVAGRLDRGTSPARIADGLLRSSAALDRPLSDQAYGRLLDRPADEAGLDYFRQRILRGASVEWVFQAVANSPEFTAVHPSPDAQLAAIYAAMLDRSPDSAGLAYFRARLDRGASPGSVVAAISHSGEYGRTQTRAAYEQILWRSADPGGLDHWAAVTSRSGWIALRAGLASSREFVDYGCDPIAPGSCMLPWPNDYFARPDAATNTGERVNMKPSQVPANVRGKRIDTSQTNRSDGFSPGSTLMVQIPGVDIDASGFPTLADMDRNDAPISDQPVVLVDTETGQTVPTWTELDEHAPYDDPDEQLLLIHPVRNLTDGHRYVVALQNLKDTAGDTIPAPPVFAAYRDGASYRVGGFDQRRESMDEVISTVEARGVPRDGLYLAWDFTVASTPNITGRLLHMRDDAFDRLGDAAPTFEVTDVESGTRDGIDRVVEGTFEVPNYLTGDGGPGSAFHENSAGLPTRNGTVQAQFRCVVPTAALTEPARASLYGHGLFGSLREVTAGNVQDMAAEHDMVFCGTLWTGMSEDDLITAAGILGDLSGFPKLADPLQQGVLNFLFLARLMKLDPGLGADPAFQNDAGDSVIAPGHVYYDGNSQGGIEGGVVMAVSTDITRGVLGVPGMNYPSLLLPRSTDFTQFELIMEPAYPSQLDRMLGLAVIQLQWDRGEPDGYANHMTTDPLPGTPEHQVLLQVALGDHQVTDYAADTEARTIGAKAYCPAFEPDRVPDTRLLWGIECIPSFPYDGSAIVYFDSGADLPVLANTLPPEGRDPHSDPRSDRAAREQKSAFLQPDAQSRVIDVCGGDPCRAPGG